MTKIAIWKHWYLVAPVLAVVGIGLLPLLRLFRNLATTGASPQAWAVRDVAFTSITLWMACMAIQVVIALHLGSRLAAVTNPLTVAFCLPVLLGPTVSALLWKATLYPGNGLLAQAVRSVSLPGWANTVTAPIMIGMVQTWTLSLAASAGVAVLFRGPAAHVRNIYLLDGGRPLWAELWALWAARREWLLILVLAISVENLRAYEITQVLTGGAFRTATFAFEVYESGFVVRNARQEAIWALLLLITNGLATLLIVRIFAPRRPA